MRFDVGYEVFSIQRQQYIKFDSLKIYIKLHKISNGLPFSDRVPNLTRSKCKTVWLLQNNFH